MECLVHNGRPVDNMADSSDSVVSNNCKDLSVANSSDKISDNKNDKGR